MTNGELLLTGVCLVLFGFCIGMLIFYLVRHLIFPQEAYAPKKQPLSYKGDVRRTIGALQQLQVVIGRESAEQYPSLVDLTHLIRRMQRDFGCNASLEGVIQALVARDIEQQLAQRKCQPTKAGEAVATVQQEAVVA